MSAFSGVVTPVMNNASGLAARTFCICGSAVVEPPDTTSSLTICMPLFSRPALKNWLVNWPSAEFSVTRATRL